MSTTTKRQIWPQSQKLHEYLDSKTSNQETQNTKKKEIKKDKLQTSSSSSILPWFPCSSKYLTSSILLETFDVKNNDGPVLLGHSVI